jgi:HAE1 family hydrophobic/amphiphilic exporter-1
MDLKQWSATLSRIGPHDSALALGVTGTGISIMVLIGLVVLAGIVVNNAIVLVDYANQLRAQGRSKVDALVEAGHARLRPILMTTLTTVLGLLPMAIAFGEGSELRAPLAITLIGGLTLATVLTLVVIPVVYASLDRTS